MKKILNLLFILEEGGLVFRNERGFTFLEGLLSLSFLLLLCVTLFPFMMKLLFNLSEGKKEMVAYRLLYEYVEAQSDIEDVAAMIKISRDVRYELYLEKNIGGEMKACVMYEEQQKCIE